LGGRVKDRCLQEMGACKTMTSTTDKYKAQVFSPGICWNGDIASPQ
jgi:hypothetical protein